MEAFETSGQRNANDPERLVELYEDGFKEIQEILVDSDLTADEQLDAIAGLMFDDEDEAE